MENRGGRGNIKYEGNFSQDPRMRNFSRGRKENLGANNEQ